jgi:hypothetical protein
MARNRETNKSVGKQQKKITQTKSGGWGDEGFLLDFCTLSILGLMLEMIIFEPS